MESSSTLDKGALVIATWFGAGLIPRAPGTMGALAALPLHWLLITHASKGVQIACIAAICCLGGFSAQRISKARNDPDPQMIVVDEVVGVLIALAVAGGNFSAQVVAFIVFRAFDIMKPWPINQLQHLSPSGLAVMADDVMAGFLAAMCVSIWLWIVN